MSQIYLDKSELIHKCQDFFLATNQSWIIETFLK